MIRVFNLLLTILQFLGGVQTDPEKIVKEISEVINFISSRVIKEQATQTDNKVSSYFFQTRDL